MPTYQTEAFVVNLYDYSETSQIVQFLTAQRGKISCIAKGVRRKNNPWKYALDRLNRVEIFFTWKSTREVQTLTEVTLINNYPELKKHIKKHVLACLILETAFSMTETEQSAPQVFTLVCKAFEHISDLDDTSENLVFLTCGYLWHLLTANGITPQLYFCIFCGKPVQNAHLFSFQGGVVCPNCKKGDKVFSSEEVHCLFTLSQWNISSEFPYNDKSTLSLYETKILPFLCSFIAFHIGHSLKSYNVLCELNHKNSKESTHETQN